MYSVGTFIVYIAQLHCIVLCVFNCAIACNFCTPNLLWTASNNVIFVVTSPRSVSTLLSCHGADLFCEFLKRCEEAQHVNHLAQPTRVECGWQLTPRRALLCSIGDGGAIPSGWTVLQQSFRRLTRLFLNVVKSLLGECWDSRPSFTAKCVCYAEQTHFKLLSMSHRCPIVPAVWDLGISWQCRMTENLKIFIHPLSS